MKDIQASPEPVNLAFDIGYLFACLPLVVDDGKKPAFSCIMVGDGWMGAANGPAALLIEKPIFKGCNYLLNGQDVAKIYDELLIRQDADANYRIDEFNLQFKSDRLAIAVLNGDEKFDIRLEDYPRINLKARDIEKPTQVTFTAADMPCFDPYLMGQFTDALTMFYGGEVNFVRALPTGRLSPMYIELSADDMHGIFMPTLSSKDKIANLPPPSAMLQ